MFFEMAAIAPLSSARRISSALIAAMTLRVGARTSWLPCSWHCAQLLEYSAALLCCAKAGGQANATKLRIPMPALRPNPPIRTIPANFQLRFGPSRGERVAIGRVELPKTPLDPTTAPDLRRIRVVNMRQIEHGEPPQPRHLMKMITSLSATLFSIDAAILSDLRHRSRASFRRPQC